MESEDYEFYKGLEFLAENQVKLPLSIFTSIDQHFLRFLILGMIWPSQLKFKSLASQKSVTWLLTGETSLWVINQPWFPLQWPQCFPGDRREQAGLHQARLSDEDDWSDQETAVCLPWGILWHYSQKVNYKKVAKFVINKIPFLDWSLSSTSKSWSFCCPASPTSTLTTWRPTPSTTSTPPRVCR